MFNTVHDAREAFRQHRERAESEFGIYPADGVSAYLPDSFKDRSHGYKMALDAQPQLVTDPGSGIPWFLTNYVDPNVYHILQAPVEAAEIYGEEKRGDWTTTTAMFITTEHTGEVSSYGDYESSGMSNANANFPLRQNYLFQTVKRWGELELDRAGEARIAWAAELDRSAANNMKRFENFGYFFGIGGLQNYGGLNDPNLPSSLTPAVKAYGGTTWFQGSTLRATPNEVYGDFLSVYTALTTQAAGYVNAKSKMTLGVSPLSASAFKSANAFGLTPEKMMNDNFPNLTVKTAVQYGQSSASNPQGISAGNFMQLIADELESQKTCFAAFSVKMRGHPIIRDLSSFKQKTTGGVFGTVIRIPIGISSMIGI